MLIKWKMQNLKGDIWLVNLNHSYYATIIVMSMTTALINDAEALRLDEVIYHFSHSRHLFNDAYHFEVRRVNSIRT